MNRRERHIRSVMGRIMVWVICIGLSMGPAAQANEGSAPHYVAGPGGTFVAEKPFEQVMFELSMKEKSAYEKKLAEDAANHPYAYRVTTLTRVESDKSEADRDTSLTDEEKERVVSMTAILDKILSSIDGEADLTTLVLHQSTKTQHEILGNTEDEKKEFFGSADFGITASAPAAAPGSGASAVNSQVSSEVAVGMTHEPLAENLDIAEVDVAADEVHEDSVLIEDFEASIENLRATSEGFSLLTVEKKPVMDQVKGSPKLASLEESKASEIQESLKRSNIEKLDDLKKENLLELLKKMGHEELVLISEMLGESFGAEGTDLLPNEEMVISEKTQNLMWLASLMQAAAMVAQDRGLKGSLRDWLNEVRSRDQTLLSNNIELIRSIKEVIAESLASDLMPTTAKDGDKPVGMKLVLAERSTALHAMHHLPPMHPFVSLLLDQKTDELRHEYVRLVETVHSIYDAAAKGQHLHIRYNGKELSNFIPLIDEKGTYELIVR